MRESTYKHAFNDTRSHNKEFLNTKLTTWQFLHRIAFAIAVEWRLMLELFVRDKSTRDIDFVRNEPFEDGFDSE